MVVGGGALLVFFGVSVLGRTVSLPLSRAIGAPLPWLRGVTGNLARQNALRNPKLPQVSAATGITMGAVEINGRVEQVAAVDPRPAGQIFDVGPVQGSIAGLGRTGIAVYSGVATAQHLRLGSRVPVLFKDIGLRKLRVALIYRDATAASAPRYFLGTPPFDANFAVRYDSQVFIKKAPDASTAAALAAVRGIATKYSGTTVMDQAAFKTARAKPNPADAHACLRPARARHPHRPARHRQHARTVDLRTDS